MSMNYNTTSVSEVEDGTTQESLYSEVSKLRLKDAVIYYQGLMAQNNLISSESSASISHEAMLMGEEIFQNTLAILAEKIVSDEGLIHENERLKPFHIDQPKVNKRDTCLCTKHENFRLMSNKLHQVGIVEPKDFSEMHSIICCNPVTEDCLFRVCSKCRLKQLISKSEADEISYYQWNTTKKSITVKGMENMISLTEKVCPNVEMLLKFFTESLPKLMKHEANHRYQYQVLTRLKNNPSEDKMVLHIDFNKNYACKLNAETQSFHFGGSRRQVTFHTEIIYYSKPNKYIKRGLCTISSSLHHDPCGVWAHLKPIFNHVVMLNSNVN
ncbi:hypothetical protein AVEN_15952-1 [Araneus ventricosus]|uniref:Uncharacterized protein n=1 Tax=Araneus ventricosus TaxID=182803 RepID=A0A4Y2S5F7_ARAVE|nr:hypothetical protein AVEN_15952-1 [Araneus ventricosus]